jgi:hypothetical protein
MGTSRHVARVAVIAAALGAAPRSAEADPRSEIVQKAKEAMDSYDLMDYEAARRMLSQALVMAKRAKLDRDALAARLYLSLGIAAYAAGDQDGAKLAFLSAIQIDARIQVPPEYRAPPLVALLDQARADAGPASDPAPPAAPPAAASCAGVRGLVHTSIDAAPAGAALPIAARVGAEVMAVKVAVMYRSEGAARFTESKLTPAGDCSYTGAIPAAALRGSVLHYYVAAYDADHRLIVGRGSASAPNVIEVRAGRGADPGSDPRGAGDDDEPLVPGAGRGGAASGGAVGEAVERARARRAYVGVAAGTGVGYVRGKTEIDNEVENCCLGASPVVLTPEVGLYVSPRLAVGLAARIGFPVGANVEGHATVAPGGMVRLRYAIERSGEGLRVMGQIGFGVLRNTVKLDDATAGMDTDIVAQGPLLIGAGLGLTKRIAGNLALVADLSLLGAIAVVDKLGSAPNLNHGLGADVSLGLALGL